MTPVTWCGLVFRERPGGLFLPDPAAAPAGVLLNGLPVVFLAPAEPPRTLPCRYEEFRRLAEPSTN